MDSLFERILSLPNLTPPSLTEIAGVMQNFQIENAEQFEFFLKHIYGLIIDEKLNFDQALAKVIEKNATSSLTKAPLIIRAYPHIRSLTNYVRDWLEIKADLFQYMNLLEKAFENYKKEQLNQLNQKKITILAQDDLLPVITCLVPKEIDTAAKEALIKKIMQAAEVTGNDQSSYHFTSLGSAIAYTQQDVPLDSNMIDGKIYDVAQEMRRLEIIRQLKIQIVLFIKDCYSQMNAENVNDKFEFLTCLQLILADGTISSTEKLFLFVENCNFFNAKYYHLPKESGVMEKMTKSFLKDYTLPEYNHMRSLLFFTSQIQNDQNHDFFSEDYLTLAKKFTN